MAYKRGKCSSATTAGKPSQKHSIYCRGDWALAAPPKNDVPSYTYQWRYVVEITGKNVRMEMDKFYSKIFIQCFKKQDWMSKPPEAPPGYYGASWWADEREGYKKMMKHGSPFEKITTVDPTKLNPLINTCPDG